MKNTVKFFILFLQALMIICAIIILNGFSIYRIIVRVSAFVLCVRIFSKQMIFAYKTLYIIFIAFFPSLGIVFYLLNIKKLNVYKKENKNKYSDKVTEKCGKTAGYIYNSLSSEIGNADKLKYYSDGKEYFNALFKCIDKSEKFIYLQYFIVKKGKLQEQLFSLLDKKAKQGVKIYFLYDAFGAMKFEKDIKQFAKTSGINVKCFNPIGFLLNGKMNNRHHGKIAVIDGKIGFLGGVNVGDEYINETRRFGRWKDGGVSFGGKAVGGLVKAFSENYGDKKLNVLFEKTDVNIKVDSSFVSVFSLSPTTGVSKMTEVYLTALYNAKKSITACTPYLIPDESVKNALVSAVKRGVDVKIVVPEIPDKKVVYKVTKAYAGELIKSGVKVYTYKSGFIHAKNTVIDGKYTITGSGNLDYRSLYLHYETGVFVKNTTFSKKTEQDITSNLKIFKDESNKICKLFGEILKVFAPLM